MFEPLTPIPATKSAADPVVALALGVSEPSSETALKTLAAASAGAGAGAGAGTGAQGDATQSKAEDTARMTSLRAEISKRLPELEWHSLRFEAHERQIVIHVLDGEGEVLRTIPPIDSEEMLDKAGIKTGVLINRKG